MKDTQPNAKKVKKEVLLMLKSNDLSSIIKEFQDLLSEATDTEVRCCIATWEVIVEEIKQLKMEIDEESIDVNLDEAVATQLKTSFENVLSLYNEKRNDLENGNRSTLSRKKRCFHNQGICRRENGLSNLPRLEKHRKE